MSVKTFRVLAQSFMSDHRITMAVHARAEEDVLRMVAAELDAAGYYVIAIQML